MKFSIAFSAAFCSLVVLNSIEVRFLMALVQWCSCFLFSRSPRLSPDESDLSEQIVTLSRCFHHSITVSKALACCDTVSSVKHHMVHLIAFQDIPGMSSNDNSVLFGMPELQTPLIDGTPSPSQFAFTLQETLLVTRQTWTCETI